MQNDRPGLKLINLASDDSCKFREISRSKPRDSCLSEISLPAYDTCRSRLSSRAIHSGMARVRLTAIDSNMSAVDDESWSEESKSSSPIKETIMDWVNKNRDLSNVSDNDLNDVFTTLSRRCKKTWNPKLEECAKELNLKVKALQKDNLAFFIDPERKVAGNGCTSCEDPKNLMYYPELWNVNTKEAGKELREVLRHFTNYAPSKGRPFIRAWLEALVPCWAHWVLLSNLRKNVNNILKYFFAAFGQPAIVVCLSDKGAKLLKTLQETARSVEALGRGSVESYYWKRLAESSCGGDNDWNILSNIPDKPLVSSQLDNLPENWLEDATDWVHVFANIVSPEIKGKFEELLEKTVFSMGDNASVHAGPAKTLARSRAKCYEYKSIYRKEKGYARWYNFRKNFRELFGRSPKKPEDFVWNIMDFARCSIIVPDATALLEAKQLIEDRFSVVCVKNGYNVNYKVKGSGYRDMKLLVEVEFDNLKLKGVAQVEQTTTLICEVQLLCKKWLENKKTTSLSYKVLRASKLLQLFSDFAKYLTGKRGDTSGIQKGETVLRNSTENLATTKAAKSVNKIQPAKVLKNGWVNLAKCTNFVDIDTDQLLVEAAERGWEAAGVEFLVRELKANLTVSSRKGFPLITLAAKYGNDAVLKTFLNLKCNPESQSPSQRTALHYATIYNKENCVRILIKAGCPPEILDYKDKTALDYAKEYNLMERIGRLLQGEEVPQLSTKRSSRYALMEEAKTAALEGRLSAFFDRHNVDHSICSELLATQMVASKVHNILQVLWFGGNVDNDADVTDSNALCYAANSGSLDSVITLIENSANVNRKVGRAQTTPLQLSARWGTKKMIDVLIKAEADVNAKKTDGWTALHFAARYSSTDMVQALVDAKANMEAKTRNGWTALALATRYQTKKMVEDLLCAGAHTETISATPDGKDNKSGGWTALHHACDIQDKSKVVALLDAGANINAKLHDGSRPVDIAGDGLKGMLHARMIFKRCITEEDIKIFRKNNMVKIIDISTSNTGIV